MRPLAERYPDVFADVRFVLTDMDETLTRHGRLAASTYAALERLQQAGIRVIPVTAAPAGWCDQMARMWPVDGVIGENGGLFYRRSEASDGLQRSYWHEGEAAAQAQRQRERLILDIGTRLPWARLAEDQPFRLTSVAFELPPEPARRRELGEALSDVTVSWTFNNLWALGWIGAYDKLAMTRRILQQEYGLTAEQELQQVFYSGDSLNDAPMFGYFRHTLGVSTLRECLNELPHLPAWISDGPGGSGFVEAVEAILASRSV